MEISARRHARCNATSKYIDTSKCRAGEHAALPKVHSPRRTHTSDWKLVFGKHSDGSAHCSRAYTPRTPVLNS